MASKFKDRPRRLPGIFERYLPPLYLVTFCTLDRRALLTNAFVHDAFKRYGEIGASEYGVGVGRYVILPDHVHVFVRGAAEFDLGLWVRGLKRAMSEALKQAGHDERIWQPGFHDHLLRHFGELLREVALRAGEPGARRPGGSFRRLAIPG